MAPSIPMSRQKPSTQRGKSRPEHWLHQVTLNPPPGSSSENSGPMALSEASRAAGVDSRPASTERADDPHSLLLAAKALVFCGFPYQRSSLTTIVRETHLGAD